MSREEWLNVVWIILRGLVDVGVLWCGWYMGRRHECAIWLRRKPTAEQVELASSQARLNEAHNVFLKQLETWSNDMHRSIDRADLERLADEMARADPPFSAEQRASAWKALAMNPGDPDKVAELRNIITKSTMTPLKLV